MATRHLCAECGVEPRLPRRQRCAECWLRAQPVTVRVAAAGERRALVPEPLRLARVPADKWPDSRRWCAGCQSFVLLTDVSGSRCKTCAGIAGHLGGVKSTYGLTAEMYAALELFQGGRCAICQRLPKTKRLVVDHEHSTGRIRGLLCIVCNKDLLGAAHHDPAVLYRAAAYLTDPPFQRLEAG